MKHTLSILFYVLICGFIAYYRNDITSFIIENLIYRKENIIFTTNEYSKSENYNYVQITNDFEVNNKAEILNAIYTILDSGMNEFVFYCAKDYDMCQYDVEKLSTNENYLSVLNNFVHPYNSYNKLYISTNNMGKIKISVDKLYSNEEIKYINDQLDVIEDTLLTSQMTDVEKIKTFHDYIINNTVYDQKRANEIESNTQGENTLMSHKANGVLTNHVALCSGYTDLMAIYLNRLNLKNYKISTINHIWNAVNINNEWLHLDLTWDDPVTDTGENVLLDDFFLISNNKLVSKNTKQHNFDVNIYKEIANH